MRGGAPRSAFVAAALFAVGLTACEGVTLPFDMPFFTATRTAQPEVSAATQPESEPEIQTGPEVEPPAGPETAARTAALAPTPEIDDDPARILGLGPDQLTEILGRPELMRREPPAEIWQYRGRSCVFDVFLYEEAGTVRVTYLEARDASARRVAERNCLNQLLRARLAEPLS